MTERSAQIPTGIEESLVVTNKTPAVEARARLSLGGSGAPIYQMVARAISARNHRGGVLVDIGCGTGQLWAYLAPQFKQYIGVDAVRYGDLPPQIEFVRHDLNDSQTPLPSGVGDVVVAVETIEHLENARAFFRELFRLAKPGGWLIVTTPNQLSLLSLLTLILKRQFNAFQDAQYPAHLTALLEIDLHRMAVECRLQEVRFDYSRSGRVVFTRYHYPGFVAKTFPRLFSDNLLIVGKKPSPEQSEESGK